MTLPSDDRGAGAQADLFAPGFAERPYWHEGVDLAIDDDGSPLPREADVVVIGGGYTGLSAAAVTASAGRSTLVLEARTLASGCSGLNGGQVGTSIKPGLGLLAARHGRERSLAILREGIEALEGIHALAREPGADWQWQPVGRFHGAHTPRHFRRLEALAGGALRELGIPVEVVPPSAQQGEVATGAYHGGLVYPRHGAVHPARLARALERRATAAGARYVERCAATAIARDGQRLRVRTTRGELLARNVLVATNGYTGPFSPWHRRRVIPITSQLVATEPLPPGLVRSLLPTQRVVTDTRRIVVYYRASPDGTRIVFGGRSTLFEMRAAVYARPLAHWLRALFPALATTRITHAWAGNVAFTFDELPHIGEYEGVHYCMGYCGSGVSLATHFGRKAGLQVLGRPEGRTALDGLPFQTRPMYTGHPWFLGPSIAAYRLLDRLGL